MGARPFDLCKGGCCRQRCRNTNFGPKNFFHQKSPPPPTFVFQGYGTKYAQRAINAFLAMKPSRVMPTSAACHAILEVCAEMEDIKEMRRLWSHIPQTCKDSQVCMLHLRPQEFEVVTQQRRKIGVNPEGC